MPGIASAATSIVIGHVANGTTTIRVGAGGIMLPNHSPLAIAEQFGTLESLYPGRIDLGLGRARFDGSLSRLWARRRGPGGRVSGRARADRTSAAWTGRKGAPAPALSADLIRPAISGAAGPRRLAVRLRVAFRAGTDDAGDRDYRAFPPVGTARSAGRMLGFNVFAADTDEEARPPRRCSRRSSTRSGRPGCLPPPCGLRESPCRPKAR
jgi:alkanesulfonate monooxygenase SsuD/methylene tetrahydromethanopterin reductase-like flavin-dependent oxidoreductase (luciferase family)